MTNTVVGGIGGLDNGTLQGGDGTGAAQVTLNVVDLALLKEARTIRGAPLASGTSINSEQEIYFLLHVNNPCPEAGSEIQIRDPLDVDAFTYIPNSLQVVIVPSNAPLSDLWDAPWQPLTDQVGETDDTASIGELNSDTQTRLITIGATPEQRNQTAYVPAGSRLVVRFRVKVN